MFADILKNVRRSAPLIHSITNYVTVNDCANILLAIGASPIMADDPEEAAEISSICAGLNLNIGTLNSRTVRSMLLAGKRANELRHPVVLDPVGAGASGFRTDTARKLLREVQFAVIRGNLSEIKALTSGSGRTRGVDANASDTIREENLESVIRLARTLAREHGTVVAVTGAMDVVTDGTSVFCIRNGHPMMAAVTGSGCQLSALTAAFTAANPERTLEAAAAAVCAMGLAGEKAFRRLSPQDGNASYRNYMIDAIWQMTPEILEEEAKYEMR